MTRSPLAIVAALLLAGCASVPSRPGVAALPGSAKSADEFRADDATCRQAATLDAKATKTWRYDMTYLECMYARGNQIPVPSGMFQPMQASPSASPAAAAPAPATTRNNQPAR